MTDRSTLVEQAVALAPLARAHAEEAERTGRLSAPVVEALREAGLFGMLVPAELGGAEADVATMVRALEALSSGDAAAGWCAMISATTGTVAGQLPLDGAREIFSDPRTIAGGTVMPPARATRVEGGYLVSGRWAFGSGSPHAEWMLGGCIVHGQDGPEMIAENVPALRMVLFPREDVNLHDTWHVSGLRGTGSNDWEVREVFVPERRSAQFGSRTRWATGPLYAFPLFGLLALGVASVGLGIARAAIDEVSRLARDKTPTGSSRRLAERAATQSGVAEAEALVRSSRAFVLETVASVWHRVAAGERMSVEDRTLLRLSATNAALSCTRAVDICYNLGGGTSIYETSPLQRQFRDIHALTQHVMVGQPTLEVVGRVMLGVPTDTSML